jgi:hypothetical protein
MSSGENAAGPIRIALLVYLANALVFPEKV